jgi:hypothetical protein
MKKVIWDLIKEGKFYSKDEKIEEDVTEVSESLVEEPSEEKA